MVEATDLIIKIGVEGALGIAFTVCGSLLAVAWWTGNRFGELGASIKGLDTRLTNIEGNMSGLIQHKSPISLTESGREALVKSGLIDFIDKNKNEFLSNCKTKYKITNAYDVQTSAFEYFEKFNFDIDVENRLKKFAFEEGIDMNIVRRLGGIYFRDVC